MFDLGIFDLVFLKELVDERILFMRLTHVHPLLPELPDDREGRHEQILSRGLRPQLFLLLLNRYGGVDAADDRARSTDASRKQHQESPSVMLSGCLLLGYEISALVGENLKGDHRLVERNTVVRPRFKMVVLDAEFPSCLVLKQENTFIYVLREVKGA